MRRVLFTVALAAMSVASADAQGPPPPGPPTGGPNDVPFKVRTTQNWGRAKAFADDGIGPAQPVEEDYQPYGPDQNTVGANISDGPDHSAQSTGIMTIWHTPVALTCISKASGSCRPSTTAGTGPRADYDVKARTEAGSGNADTKTRNIVITITGSRSSLSKSNVGGIATVTIGRADGTTDSYQVKVVKGGWKLVGQGLPPEATIEFSRQWQESLAPGDSVGITCVASASNAGENAAYTESELQLKVNVSAVEEVDGSGDVPPPPPGP